VITSVSSLSTTVTDLGPWPVRSSSNVLAASAICCAIVLLGLSIVIVFGHWDHLSQAKKTGVVEHPQVFHHAGLLVNEPPGNAGMPLI
jgi:hypothetical protein